ncbi:MAG: hypothetical protein ACRERE_04465 [Candidatus Entotheonellia bacterium]
MRPIGATIRHEIRELLPAVIYFVITFNIIGFTKVLMLREYGITVSTFVGATLGALLVAKAVLIVGVLPFMEPFPKLPIVYNVLWKTLLYALAAFLIQVLEEVMRALLTHGGLAPAWDVLGRPHFWGIQIWLVMVLLVFCTFRELIRVLGPEQAREIFLGIRSSHGT